MGMKIVAPLVHLPSTQSLMWKGYLDILFRHYCVDCEFSIYNINLLKQHMANVHGYGTTILCPKENCEKKSARDIWISITSFVRLKRICSSVSIVLRDTRSKFLCNMCGKTYPNRNQTKDILERQNVTQMLT